MSKFTTRDLTLAAVLAAVYAALTMLLPSPSTARSSSAWRRP